MISRENNINGYHNLATIACSFFWNWLPEYLQLITAFVAIQDYTASILCNVHKVNPKFLEIDKKKREKQ